MKGYEIRRVREADRSAVVGIFNYFVENSFAAYPDKKVGPEIFDLLRDYMEADHRPVRWITVQEFRTYFTLPKSCSPVIAGYFQRIYQNPTYLCPYRVIRIEQVRDPANPYRYVRRYIVGRSLPFPENGPQRSIRNTVSEASMRTLNH